MDIKRIAAKGVRLRSVINHPIRIADTEDKRVREFLESDYLVSHFASPSYLTAITFAFEVISSVSKRRLGIPLTSARALNVLRNSDETMNAKDVMCSIGHPTDPGTRTFDLLAEKGYIDKLQNHSDKRMIDIHITPAGIQALDETIDEVVSRFEFYIDLYDSDQDHPHEEIDHGLFEQAIGFISSPNYLDRLVELHRIASTALDHTDSRLTLTQYRIIAYCLMLDKKTPLGDIRRHLHLRANTLSSAISKLEAHNFVKRARGKDLRQIDLVCTEAGALEVDRSASHFYESLLRYHIKGTESYKEVHGYIYATIIVSLNVLINRGIN